MSGYANWVALRTIVTKEVLRFSRIWIQTILPPVITMGLYFIIFGGLIGSRIGEMEGIRYMDFIVPGLIMMAVITNSYSNVVSSFYSAKFQRHLEEMLVSPVPNYLIILGFVAGGICRGLAVGVAVTLISMIFSPLSIHNLAITLSVVLLTATLFALAGLINGVFARSFDDISIVPTFILTPLTYLGGVFYSITLLPEFWQGASMLNPILYMVNAFRYGFLGVADIGLATSYGIIIGFVVLLYGVALLLLNKGVGIRN
ncbi:MULTISPECIES: ABC transporter permease [Ectothiorhodospira]|uniref:ABC transporter permease n=1 Tax=Ectothiorhodospira TaxID=1051 RepID=UPI001EE9379E|nr:MULTISPECIES: ABC transporter permease [Ectothiorhodospira]MCG5493739.1 ABC transporter permease [Ectothiorhodospira variabilis]MCG5503938.1 ABC transporter permease [Ectothiorhodospira variabilis]MCG5507093.1 ABC transporter permease [Ectothiorhodospira variabilis]MCG5524839.1 ABC transporter permease [Ectothiorhodospira haloalkaliphila]